MASKNYTKAQATRITRRMMRSLLKMYDDDYITTNDFMNATKEVEKIFRKLKK